MVWLEWPWRILQMQSSYLEVLQEIARTGTQKDFLSKVKIMGKKLNNTENQVRAGFDRGINYVVDEAMKAMGADAEPVYEEMESDWWNSQKERKEVYLRNKKSVDKVIMQFKMKLKKEIPMIKKNMVLYIKLADEFKNFVEKNGESISATNSKWYQMLGWKRATTGWKKGHSIEISDGYKKIAKVSPNAFLTLIPERFIRGLSDDYDSKLSVSIFGEGNSYLHQITSY